MIKPLDENRSFINCCPTGMIPTKEMTPYVPTSPEEITAEGLELSSMGVSILHLHARDCEGKPTWKKETYKRIIGGIREIDSEIIICVSTSGRLWSDFERRSEVLDLKDEYRPDMASLTLGSLNFMKQASINEPQMIEDLAKKMADTGIKPELEVFDLGMINSLLSLLKKGLIAPPFYLNALFGNFYTMQLNLNSVTALINTLPEDTICGFAGLGRFQFQANTLGLNLGFGVRVGLEDNIFFDKKRKELATNYSLVKRITNVAYTLEKNFYSPKEMRDRLNLSKK